MRRTQDATLNLRNKVLVFVGWYSWIHAFTENFSETPRRTIFALSEQVLEGPFAHYIECGMKEKFSGVELVYCSEYQEAQAIRMKKWIEESYPIVPSVRIRHIKKVHCELVVVC